MPATRHQYRIFIKATPETVWQALIDPQFTRRYFHGTAFAEPPALGAPFRTVMADGQPAIEGTIEELDPPRRFVHTWRVLYDAAMAEEPPSRVEWTLTDVGSGMTQLDLVHGDLARSPLTWAHTQYGWYWIIDSMKTLLETGEPLPAPTAQPEVAADAAGEWHRAQGVEANNSIWEMLDAERNAANDEEMLRRAYASAYHWQRAARRQPVNEARALYMLAKAHLAAGLNERALHYAQACATATSASGDGAADFDHAYAHEMLARAFKAVGRVAEAETEWKAALAVPIADPDDKAIVDGDLAVAL